MTFDVKCTNKECDKVDKVFEVNIPHSKLEEQICPSCLEKVTRCWNSIGIKTHNDGYKA
jgi:hypothetical protein